MKLIVFLILPLLFCINKGQSIQNKVEYKYNSLDSALTDIIWCGGDSKDVETMLILTDLGSVYRSSDKGLNWQKLTNVFLNKGYEEIETGEEVFKK